MICNIFKFKDILLQVISLSVLILILSLIVFLILILLYFFCIAFVKHNTGDTDNLDDPINNFLSEYKDEIKKGMDYNNSQPHKWIYTESFDGLKLAARYYDNKSDKTVILFHGYRSSALRDFSCAVEMYKSFGFNVLLCDQRSHGRSDGKLITFGAKEKYDVITWCEYVTEKYSAKKIILGGMSMGATTVLLSLGLDIPKNVEAVIADCGFTSPEDIILKVAKQNYRINAKLILPLINIFCIILGKFSIYNNDTRVAVKKCDIPILLIHGESDGFVPCEMSKETIKNANVKSSILLVENADHGLSFLVDCNLVKSSIKKFLKEYDLY